MMKKTLWIGCGVIAALVVGWILFWPKSTAPKALTTSSRPTLWVLSDPHFIAPSLQDEGKAYTEIKQTAAGKDMDYQPQTIRAFVHAARQARPTAVVITGDLTFNGAKASAESLAHRLAPLTQAGIKLLVIPGNHDIYDGWARKYQGSQQIKVGQISPNDWRQIWAESYQYAASTDPASLSYRVNLNHDYQLLCLDSNNYPIQPSSQAPNTGGALSADTLKWLETQLLAGQRAHRQSLVFMHHNLYQHNAQVHQGFVLDNATALKRLLDHYGVKIVFSGHIHAQDISHDPDGNSPITEIVSGSFATSPNGFGEVSLSPTGLTYHRQALDLSPVLTRQERRNPDLVHHQAYLKRLFEEDAQPMAFAALAESKLPEKRLVAATKLFGQLNWQYFTGTNNPSAQALASLQASPDYQALWSSADLRGYLKTIVVDKNVPDNVNFSETW
ncbi:metallophosphoesterase [Lacticaseibacillus brantae]